jgi:hypothetical protein
MCLALNAGFAKRECATLQVCEIVEGAKHKYIKRYRQKTGVYGEWLLWDITLEALDYLAKYRKPGAIYAVANEAGEPLVRPVRSGTENPIIRNHWWRLRRRILKDQPEFYALPFKYLRKTGARYIRHMKGLENAAEIASMYLSHGEESDSPDTLLPVYAGRPWKRLHKTLLRLRRKLQPVFESVENPWEQRRTRVAPATLARIAELRGQGLTYVAVAKIVGMHEATIRTLYRVGEIKTPGCQDGSQEHR